MSLARRENPTPFPEGTRVVTTPFEHRGVTGKSTVYGTFIILDEPMKHTDRVQASWDEVHLESDYDIAAQQYYVDDAKERVQDLQADIRSLEKRLTNAKKLLADERKVLRKVKAKYS
jgi:hypothetical protein